MRVIIATNEPWGVYHCAPLVKEARDLGVDLVQWVPDKEHLPSTVEVEIETDFKVIREADLVVVNGLFSDHTLSAAALAREADVPLCLSELAYLRAIPSSQRHLFDLVQANSPATAVAVGIHSETAPEKVSIVGWPGLDNLPSRKIKSGLVVALTGVSQQTITGGNHEEDDHTLLFNSLVKLESEGYEISVRRHPRETNECWERWTLRDSGTTAAALSDAELVIGLAGTPAFYTAAYGIPFLGICSLGLPDYIASCVYPLTDANQVLELASSARPISSAHKDWVCGPIGEAATRMIEGWLTLSR
jgi:hypothetical protein